MGEAAANSNVFRNGNYRLVFFGALQSIFGVVLAGCSAGFNVAALYLLFNRRVREI